MRPEPTKRLGRRWLGIGTAMLLCLCGLSCGRAAVRASEKEFLANPMMQFDLDPHEAKADNHILDNREGASGGKGAGGGGCGCN